MSLKAFHVFFIVIAILFSFGFGAWGLLSKGTEQAETIRTLALILLPTGIALVVYLILFLKKMRRPELK